MAVPPRWQETRPIKLLLPATTETGITEAVHSISQYKHLHVHVFWKFGSSPMSISGTDFVYLSEVESLKKSIPYNGFRLVLNQLGMVEKTGPPFYPASLSD